jgi:uncharacterized protein (TIGR02466 family)|tara:strand:+ start:70 stop:720 length:651 start_codon:yes stop_codon:yes gene_type:complete
MELTTSPIFQSAIYRTEAPQYLDLLNLVCDPFIVEAKKKTAPQIVSREAKAGKDIGDIGLSYHTENLMKQAELYQFRRFIKSTSENILDAQGYDLKDYDLKFTEMWCQEFANQGGGHHDTHIHWNNHISGFYFLKCSDRTSAPLFHDPRAGKMMTQLPEKDRNIVTLATEKVLLRPKPGTVMFFNSYLPHQFAVDNGVDPFRFIHFNLQAIPKNVL